MHSLELVGFEDVSKRLGTTGALAVSIVFRKALRVVSHSVMLLNYAGLVDVRLSELLQVLGGAWGLAMDAFSDAVVSRLGGHAVLLETSWSNLGVWVRSVGARILLVA